MGTHSDRLRKWKHKIAAFIVELLDDLQGAPFFSGELVDVFGQPQAIAEAPALVSPATIVTGRQDFFHTPT